MVAVRTIVNRADHVYVVLLDDEDTAYYDQYTWQVGVQSGDRGNAVRSVNRSYTDPNTPGWGTRKRGHGTPQKVEQIARKLLGLADGDPREADHINRNPLDNQKANLRPATKQQNALNRNFRQGALPRGVRFFGRRYEAGIYDGPPTRNGRAQRRRIGLYDTAEEAGAAALAERIRVRGAEFVRD